MRQEWFTGLLHQYLRVLQAPPPSNKNSLQVGVHTESIGSGVYQNLIYDVTFILQYATSSISGGLRKAIDCTKVGLPVDQL